MKVGIIIKKLREEREMTIKMLAEKAGVSTSSISEIERGANKGKISTLEKICKGLNATPEERKLIFSTLLPQDLGTRLIKGNAKIEEVKEIKLIEVPLFKSVSAGFGCEAIDDIYDFITTTEIKGNIIAIEVQGDSMEDTIMDGAVVIVNKDIMPEVGDVGVFLTTGTEYPDGLVKRLRCKNGTYVLESDNPKYDDIIIDSKNIVACGKVVKIENEPKKRKKDPILVGFNKLSEADQAVVRSMIEALSQKNK